MKILQSIQISDSSVKLTINLLFRAVKFQEEFYSSLAHLIAMYPTINVWLFKINKETNGRGIAYLELSKIDKLTQLKQEKNN